MVFTALCRSTGGSSSVLMTADPDVTDEWWRSTEDQNLGWKRIAPDFYTLNKSYPNNPSSINDRLLHLYIDSQKNPLNDWSIAPRNPPRTNHISGETYYVRSKSDPKIFWLSTSSGVYGSTLGRTRFRITMKAEKEPGAKKGRVMIGNDLVYISPVTRPDLYLGVEKDGKLIMKDAETDWYFTIFKSWILAEGEFLDDNTGYSVLKKGENGDGEEWELVK